MANVIDDFISKLQGTSLIKNLQNTAPIQNIQNLLSSWAAQNPTQAGNILKATNNGSYGITPFGALNTVAQPIVQKNIVQPVQNAVKGVVNAMPKTAVKAATPVTTVKKPVIAPPSVPSVVQKPVSFGQLSRKTNTTVAGANTGTSGTQAGVIPATVPTNTGGVDPIQAFKDQNRAYYEKLLADSNWDVNEAMRRLEEQHAMGTRFNTEDQQAAAKDLFTQQFPQEQTAMAENLNKRGLLSNPLGAAQQLSMQTPGGTGTTTVQNPVLTRQYGGIAGNQINQMQNAQQARAEAIGRAFSQREAQLQLPVTQGQRAQTQGLAQNQYANQQKMNTDAATAALAGDAYQRKLQGAGLQTAQAG